MHFGCLLLLQVDDPLDQLTVLLLLVSVPHLQFPDLCAQVQLRIGLQLFLQVVYSLNLALHKRLLIDQLVSLIELLLLRKPQLFHQLLKLVLVSIGILELD